MHIPAHTKWILYKHTSSREILVQTALELKAASKELTKDARRTLLQNLQKEGLYVGRNPDQPLDSIQHRINTLIYYSIGYRENFRGSKRFIFSPLGNLFLNHLDNPHNLSKIFISCLWAKQFPDPFFGTPASINIFPFRIVLLLLCEQRLQQSLSGLEYAHCLSGILEADDIDISELVSRILKFRNLAVAEKESIAKSNENYYVNAYHEWQYTSRLLASFDLGEIEKGSRLFSLKHGASTVRAVNDDYFKLNPIHEKFIEKLETEYSYKNKPLLLNDPERLREDAIKELYAFCPNSLLLELGHTPESKIFKLAKLPQMLSEAALNSVAGDPDKFEKLLEEAMNLFDDIDARRISGAGNTDIECLYLTERTKFAVEAKSTKTKLQTLNAARLATHRSLISAEYTLVITPKYSPAVITDIANSKNVIVLVNTFAEYLYHCLLSESGSFSFKKLNKIAKDSFGGDMSAQVSKLTMEEFAVNQDNLKETDD
jgi:type II restriction enzyme